MTPWIRRLFRSTPVASVVKQHRTRLGLQQLEERDTPATFNVTTTADSGAGSLRDAVSQANTTAGADTITFAAGLGDIVLTSAELTITDTTGATTITGPTTGMQVVQRSTASGTPNFRIFRIASFATANMSGLTISNGKTDILGSGGGIYNGGTLVLSNSTLTGNTATGGGSGGGITSDRGTLTVTNSTLTGNTAPGGSGGAIFMTTGNGTLILTSSTLSGNTATGGSGGGIYMKSGTATLNSMTVTGSNADLGGGIFSNATLTLTNSTVSANTASIGGGIISSGTATLINSTVSGNSAKGDSGGILLFGNTTITNVTVTGNRSDSDNSGAETGGGLSSRSGATATLNNTLIAGNFRGTGTTRDDVAGAVVASSVNNLIGDGTNLTGITNGSQGNQIGTGAAPIDPLLQPLANNGGVTLTHALGQNSPALGKGSASVAGYSVYDQRGNSRDAAGGASPDIGAYEVNHPLATVGAPTTLAGLYSPKPSASANEAFVKGLYQSTLLRAPDAAGLAGWVSALNGGMSRSTVANGFVNSTENRRAQVTFFYRYFLSREPDTAGLNGWVTTLQGGTDEGQVMTGFILSNEFSGLNNNSQFVNLMYYALLSRQADTAGFNGWVNALNTGTSRATVVNAFLRSEEGINRVVDSMFQTYLKRYGSAGDLSAFRTYLATNTFGQAATLILSSAEFFTNAGNNLS